MDSPLFKVETHGNNEMGYLSFFESKKDIPFEFKRIYYLHNVAVGIQRGMHAHKELQQVLWCPQGKIEVTLDNGQEKKKYSLDSPDKVLLVMEGYWHDMYWLESGSILCVAASDYYCEDDYIRNYEEFLKYVKEGYWKNGDKV